MNSIKCLFLHLIVTSRFFFSFMLAYFPYSTTVLWEDNCVNYNWTISMNSVEYTIAFRFPPYQSRPLFLSIL